MKSKVSVYLSCFNHGDITMNYMSFITLWYVSITLCCSGLSSAPFC